MNKKFSFNIGGSLNILIYGSIYGLIAVFLAVFQTTLIPRIHIYDSLPDICIGAVVCIGVYRNEKTASLFGLFTGLCVDGLGNFGVSFLPLFYVVVGFCAGYIGRSAREKARFAAFLVTLPAVCLIRTLITFIDCMIKFGVSLNYSEYLLYTALPEFLSALVLCIPVYLFVKLFELPLYIARKKGWVD